MEHGLDLADARCWYDGYDLPAFRPEASGSVHISVYAPYSVMRACARRRTGSYWPSTETFEELRHYIVRDLGVPILVVAVTYDAKTKEHACRIFEA